MPLTLAQRASQKLAGGGARPSGRNPRIHPIRMSPGRGGKKSFNELARENAVMPTHPSAKTNPAHSMRSPAPAAQPTPPLNSPSTPP